MSPRVCWLPLVLLACGGGDAASSSTDEPLPDDTDLDTSPDDDLPFDLGAWAVEFLAPDTDGCNLDAEGVHTATFARGTPDFLVDFADPPIGPASFDCDLRGFTFTCEDAADRVFQGTFSGRGAATGSFRDESCGTVQSWGGSVR